MKKYTVAIAGTTSRTVQCAEALKKSDLFEIVWILTPGPKPVGRKKVMASNPLDLFSKENQLKVVYVDRKINGAVEESIRNIEQSTGRPDFLLVVDFGYLVPNWLLKIPTIAPLNIHPSKLPRWRGSSPGQFSILFNDKKSAVTLMTMNEKLDEGDIIHQDFFKVEREWTQNEYYQRAFDLICENLDQKIAKFAEDPKIAVVQPLESPTLIAGMLNKKQTFIDWEVVKAAMNGEEAGGEEAGGENDRGEISAILSAALEHNQSLALTLERASKAFSPWPNLWTIIPTEKGEKRMKLLEVKLKNQDDPQVGTPKESIELIKVQVEGKNPDSWNSAKNILK
jgi:methionyl-tRNA formyltransferase